MKAFGPALGEHDRMLANLLMIGVVAELDEAAARVTLDVCGLRTDWLPWIVRRAGPDAEWWAPEVGEQVLVACPCGDPSQGVIVGSIYQQDFPAPAAAKTVRRVTFADGSSVEYDREANRLQVDVAGAGLVVVNCATATVVATESVTLDTPATRCTGNLQVDGSMNVDGESTMQGSLDVQGSTTLKGITSNGVDIGSTHKHSGVEPGGGQTGNPV